MEDDSALDRRLESLAGPGSRLCRSVLSDVSELVRVEQVLHQAREKARWADELEGRWRPSRQGVSA